MARLFAIFVQAPRNMLRSTAGPSDETSPTAEKAPSLTTAARPLMSRATRSRSPTSCARSCRSAASSLEVASGTGEHVLHFARAFPSLDWQPSDPDPAALASIEAWRIAAGSANLLPPVALDARAPDWPIAAADAVMCINMVHISPWAATVGLMRGAGRLLAAGCAALSLRRLPPGGGRDGTEQ